MPEVELILKADNTPYVQKIREAQRANQELYTNVEKGLQREKGLMEDIEDTIKKYQEAKKKAFTVEDIEKYNRKIQEAKQDLKEYENAGKETEKQILSLTSSISKWALGLGGAAVALKILLNTFKETTAGINIFNQVAAVTKQALNDIVGGMGLSVARMREAILVQRELNALRIQEYKDSVEAAKQQLLYNKYYFEASDRRKTDVERIDLYNKAMVAHNKMLDIKIEHTKTELAQAEKAYMNAPANEKRLKRVSDLNVEIINLEGQRYSGLKRIEGAMTSLLDKNVEELNSSLEGMKSAIDKWEKDYADAMKKAAEKEKRLMEERLKNMQKLKEEMYDLVYNIRTGGLYDAGSIIENILNMPDEIIPEHMKLKINKSILDLNKELIKANAGKYEKLEADALELRMQKWGAFQDSMKEVFSNLSSIFDNEYNLAQRHRELLDQRVSETEEALNREIELYKAGYASNVILKEKELEEIKKARDEAQAEEEKAIKRQLQLEAAAQAASLASAVANMFSKETKRLGVFGLLSAGIGVASMFAAFMAALSKAKSVTQLAEGGTGTTTGIVTGRSHAAGGERFLDHVEVERGERWGVLNRRASEKFGKTFDYIVNSFNKNMMPDFIEPAVVNNIKVDNSGSNNRLDKVIAEQRQMNKKLSQQQIIIQGNRKIIRNGNKIRIVG